jgi:hypothetical protein
MLNQEQKSKIIEAIKAKESNYPSAAKYAVFLDLNPGVLSRIKKGDIDNVLSDAKLITIARKLGVEMGNRIEVVAAQTPVFVYINQQLAACQQFGMSGIFCDSADIGKTYAAKYYCNANKNAVYVDCSQVKTKPQLIRAIARGFGLSSTGKYADVYDDLVYYIKSIPTPLVVLDEVGDLSYAAFLELKAIWNSTEYCCGWYMMGADGLMAKIDGNINRKKVGYAEIFSRFGSRYQSLSPHDEAGKIDFAKRQTAIIAKANGIVDVQALFAKTQGSLRRIYIEIQKIKTQLS